MGAGAASGGAAGSAKHVAQVPRQQCLERLDGIGSRELFEQVGQVRGWIQAIGVGRSDKGEEVRARASTERILREEPHPVSLREGRMMFST